MPRSVKSVNNVKMNMNLGKKEHRASAYAQKQEDCEQLDAEHKLWPQEQCSVDYAQKQKEHEQRNAECELRQEDLNNKWNDNLETVKSLLSEQGEFQNSRLMVTRKEELELGLQQ